MYTGEILELVEKKSIELEKLFGCKIVDIDKVSKYLGIDVDTVKDLINDGSVPCFNKNKYLFLLSDIVKFMLGIQDEVTVNSGRNNIGMVQFPYNILEDISEEDFNMAIQTYGEGSVYWNEKRKCFQIAFYMDVGAEKKRKVVSGKTENDVISKRALIMNSINSVSTITIINGRGVEKNITKTKVSEALDKYLIMRKRTKEYATYDLDFHMAKHIKGYIGARYIDELTREDMQTLLFVVAGYDLENEEDDIDCDNMVSESLLKSVRLLLKQFMDFAVEHKYVAENLAEKLQLPKCKKTDKDSKFLNKEEVARLFRLVKNNLRYTTILEVLLSTGLRIGELLALKWNDIYLKGNQWYVRVDEALKKDGKKKYKIGEPKTKSSKREVPVDKEIIDIINKWQDSFTDKYIALRKKNLCSEIIFTNDNGMVMNYSTLRRKFLEYLTEKGKTKEEHFTFHMMRHCYCSFLYDMDYPLERISKLMGHSSVAVTEKIYLTILSNKYDDSVEKVVSFRKNIKELVNEKA